MRSVRTVLAGVVLTVGLLATGSSLAAADPVPGVVTAPAQDPVPDPNAGTSPPAQTGGATTQTGGATAPVGSVSDVAASLAADQVAAAGASPSTLGRAASPAAKSAAIWDGRGRPDRLIIVRRTGIDSVLNGRLLRHLVRPVGHITLGSVAASVPSSWLSVTGPTARLSATLVLSTGVTLDAGAPITSLLLVGGATAPAAASVFTGSGTLTVHGVRISSADAVTGAPMPVGPGRPYLSVAAGGRVEMVGSTLDSLGATAGPKTDPGLVFGAGSSGSVVASELTRNTVGLALDRSNGVALENVTVSQSIADGLVLTGDTGTTMLDVMAAGNGRNGVLVQGPSSPRPITGITTHGNHEFGLAIDGQVKPKISTIVTNGDGAGGLEINRSTDVSVAGLTSTDEPVGLYTHVSSARVTLDRLTVTGGRLGVAIEKTTADLTLTNSTVKGADVGMSLGGHQMQLTDVTVVGSQTAAVVERGAAGAGFERLTISGGTNGLIANPGTTGVVVRDLATGGVSDTAVRALSPGEQIVGGQIDGSVTGIDIQAPMTLSGVAISGVETGVRARTPLSVAARQLDINAASVGINVADGTPFVLADSRVHALESVRGSTKESGVNDLSLPALSVLGAIGVPLILLAVLLEGFAVVRQRRSGRRQNGPPGPAGPATSPSVRIEPVGAVR